MAAAADHEAVTSIASGQIRYVIVGGGDQGGVAGFGGRGNSEVTAWVTSTCTAVTIDGTTLYDCAAASVG